jgi:hypothetical protein
MHSSHTATAQKTLWSCLLTGLVWLTFATSSQVYAESLLVEAESFDDYGGWNLDTQFIQQMGSPYLLAHGLGKPVADATKKITFKKPGKYHLYVRTKDWVAHWNVAGAPGRFQVILNGQPVETTFGNKGAEWNWQDGGMVEITGTDVVLSIRDLTGFDGRCDAIYFTTDDTAPPVTHEILSSWRRGQLGLPENPIEKSGYDLVVIGGGYSGLGAAISASRAGCKVALIQDRGVLGGNGSSEVRVWAMGNIRRGKYPRIGEIIDEISDHAKKSPGTYEEFEDAKKEAIVREEKNIDLFLFTHAYQVEVERKNITSVTTFNTKTSEIIRFSGKFFADCTGHGTIGYLAKADFTMEEKGRMGMSNMWAWAEDEKAHAFPDTTPWALPLAMKDFPYPQDHHAQWFWESGFDKDPIKDAEYIRDWNLRAAYGAFNAMKNGDGAKEHPNAQLTWLAYIGGPRESRLLQGDIVLTQEDIIAKREFPDGCVPSTWSIDLHYPKKQFAGKFADNPFISIAEHDNRVDRVYGYPIPYRCFYSRNIENLFMAGRCISVTHEALGTVRVMKTCGMMGEVVGKATSICLLRNCQPRDVADRYWPEMDELLKLPGKAYRATINDQFTIPKDALPEAPSHGPFTGIDPSTLPGIVIDDAKAKKTGNWTGGTGLKGYVGYGYIYAGSGAPATVTFEPIIDKAGDYEFRIAYQPHENRSNAVPVTVKVDDLVEQLKVNMQIPPPGGDTFFSIGTYHVAKDELISVTISNKDVIGNVHADALQILPGQTAKTK